MPSELAAALIKVQQKLKPIKRTATGQRSKYPDLATVHKAVFPLLGEQGLAFIAKPTMHADGRFVLAYSLVHAPSGETESGEYPMHGGNAQQQASDVTYARRYALMAVTGAVAEGEDDDGQEASEGHMDRRPGPEHRRLVRATSQHPLRTADRPPAGTWDGEDHWVDQPPGELPPPLASAAQIGAIWTVLGKVFKFGHDEKDQARAVCAHILGHPLASTKEMTKAEAGKVIDTLAEWQELARESRMTPREFLTAEMVGAASAAVQDAAEGAQEPVDTP